MRAMMRGNALPQRLRHLVCGLRVGRLESQGGDGKPPLFLCQGRRNGISGMVGLCLSSCTPWSDDLSFLSKSGGEAIREEGVRNCGGG